MRNSGLDWQNYFTVKFGKIVNIKYGYLPMLPLFFFYCYAHFHYIPFSTSFFYPFFDFISIILFPSLVSLCIIATLFLRLDITNKIYTLIIVFSNIAIYVRTINKQIIDNRYNIYFFVLLAGICFW